VATSCSSKHLDAADPLVVLHRGYAVTHYQLLRQALQQPPPYSSMHTNPAENIHHLSLKGVTKGAYSITDLSQLCQKRGSPRPPALLNVSSRRSSPHPLQSPWASAACPFREARYCR